MKNPQTEEPASVAPLTFQATTTGTVTEEIPRVDGPAAEKSGSPVTNAAPSTAQQEALGVGVEGETTVWTGGYSLKNFAVRTALRVVVTIGWIVLLGVLSRGTRDPEVDQGGWNWLAWLGWGALLVYWLMLGWQFLLARLGHRYELTTRRLFVETGFFRRRRDQAELLRVQDIYVKQQGILARLLDYGTVVVESKEERMPLHYLAGVTDPNGVMNLIWHHARKERDTRSVKVDEV